MQTIRELPNGEFEVEAGNGEVLGPFRLRETAESAERMLNTFDGVDTAIARTLNIMRGAA